MSYCEGEIKSEAGAQECSRVGSLVGEKQKESERKIRVYGNCVISI